MHTNVCVERRITSSKCRLAKRGFGVKGPGFEFCSATEQSRGWLNSFISLGLRFLFAKRRQGTPLPVAFPSAPVPRRGRRAQQAGTHCSGPTARQRTGTAGTRRRSRAGWSLRVPVYEGERAGRLSRRAVSRAGSALSAGRCAR